MRNSLDHGIELPENRVAAGKSPVGNLILSAEHQGGNICIEVTDDGAGLNRERILAKAISQGMAVNENMTDEEVGMLILPRASQPQSRSPTFPAVAWAWTW